MRIIRSLQALKAALPKKTAKRVGFVPTMGYLHEGHLSLVRRSKRENDLTVVSIFVNPIQFGPSEDLKSYPRDLAADRRVLEKVRTDILFVPSAAEFYPKDFQTEVSVKKLSRFLCGRSRPVHFVGVATVVLKLLNLVRPDVLYLGEKDYQQCRVVEQMVKDLSVPVQIRRMSIVREPDGLAMSSRNIRLSPSERRQALVLRQALQRVQKMAQKGERRAPALKKEALKAIRSAPAARVDYLEIVDARTLEDVLKLMADKVYVAAGAVYFGKTRLIDNVLLKG